MAITNAKANSILTQLIGKTSTHTQIWAGLHNGAQAPTKEGTFQEPSGDGYSRTLIGYYNQPATYKMGTPSEAAVTNEETVFFSEVRDGTGTGAWGTCTHVLLFDAQTGGNLLAFDALENPLNPVDGDVPLIRVGDLTIHIE